MEYQYIAYVYCNEEKIATQSGDDIEHLYAWMLAQVNGNFGNVHGEIVECKTNEIIKTFNKSYLD